MCLHFMLCFHNQFILKVKAFLSGYLEGRSYEVMKLFAEEIQHIAYNVYTRTTRSLHMAKCRITLYEHCISEGHILKVTG